VADVHETAEGWFRDPFGVHEDRWISGGRPTKLVRDGGVEGSDEPPPGPMPTLVSIPPPETAPDDTPSLDREMVDTAMETTTIYSPPS